MGCYYSMEYGHTFHVCSQWNFTKLLFSNPATYSYTSYVVAVRMDESKHNACYSIMPHLQNYPEILQSPLYLIDPMWLE